jgi:hypothetical protein
MEVEEPTQPTNKLSPISLAIVGGLAPGGKLRENRMVEVTPLGLIFRGEMSKDQFFELFALLKRVKDTYHVMLADAVKEAHSRHGAEFTSGALEQLEFEIPDVVRANTIGLAPAHGRNIELTNEHYFVIGKAIAAKKLDDTEAAGWLATAAAEKLTPQELEDSIAAGKVVRIEGGTNRRTSGIATIEGIVFQAEQWKRKVDPEVIQTWEPERKRKLLTELQALEWLHELRLRIAAELSAD